MNHIGEIVGGVALVAAAVGGALAVLPRPKPEPPPAPVVLEFKPKPVQRAEPIPVKTDAERVDDLQAQLRDIAAEQKRLVEQVEAVAESEKKK